MVIPREQEQRIYITRKQPTLKEPELLINMETLYSRTALSRNKLLLHASSRHLEEISRAQQISIERNFSARYTHCRTSPSKQSSILFFSIVQLPLESNGSLNPQQIRSKFIVL